MPSFSSSEAALNIARETIVSQNVLAVSASAIGVRRWYGVFETRLMLWYAWPSSCATVATLMNVFV